MNHEEARAILAQRVQEYLGSQTIGWAHKVAMATGCQLCLIPAVDDLPASRATVVGQWIAIPGDWNLGDQPAVFRWESRRVGGIGTLSVQSFATNDRGSRPLWHWVDLADVAQTPQQALMKVNLAANRVYEELWPKGFTSLANQLFEMGWGISHWMLDEQPPITLLFQRDVIQQWSYWRESEVAMPLMGLHPCVFTRNACAVLNRRTAARFN